MAVNGQAPAHSGGPGSAAVVDALVVGAGLSGIGAGVTLKKAGYEDFVIIDKAPDFGGTWRANTYPGVACDIPSQVYSFGFAPHREWSRIFAPGEEIHAYLSGIAADWGLRPHARFGTELRGAEWDDADGRWSVETSAGPYRCRILILGTGILEDPRLPDVPGLDTFPGRVFHSSRWPGGYDPRGDRVALVGTGASAIQILPELQPVAARLSLFQRTPAWVLPKPDWTHSAVVRWSVRQLPWARRALRGVQWAGAELFLASLFSVRASKVIAALARWNIRRAVEDPAMRAALTPGYVVGCKRALLSNTFYPALASDNVEFVPSAMAAVRGSTVIAADGSERDVDTIILGTGFHVVDAPIYAAIRGRDGLSLHERWRGSPKAYKGVTMAGCPNAFILWGPNGSSASVFTAVESSLGYLGAALRTMRERRISSVEVRAEAEAAWKAMANRYTARSMHNIGGCQTYYLDTNGDNLTLFPATMRGMREQLSTFDLGAYHVRTNERVPR